jgi:hypothetical protein
VTKIHSFKYGKNKLWVACTECERGGNGASRYKCGGNAANKRFCGLGCFTGELIAGIKI